MVTLVKPEQPLKVAFLIVDTAEGIAILVNAEQYAKALLPIELTVEGRVTAANLLQP